MYYVIVNEDKDKSTRLVKEQGIEAVKKRYPREKGYAVLGIFTDAELNLLRNSERGCITG